MKKTALGILIIGALFAASAANAAIDVTAVTTGIDDASTALQSVVAALMSLSVGLFGITKVYRFVSKKAGA